MNQKSVTIPDHIYFNLTFTNNNVPPNGTTPQYVPARVMQTYDRVIVPDPSKYNVSIVRFAISSDALNRVYQPYPTTTMNTTFWAGVGYTGTYYNEPIVLPVMVDPNGVNIQGVNNVNLFIDQINTAYGNATTALAATGPTGIGQPLITYNPVDGLYTMNIPSWMHDNNVSVTMSYQLYHRFLGFSATVNNPLLYNNRDVTFNQVYRGDNLTSIEYPIGTGGTGPTGPYLQMRQDCQWPSSIMDINRLIIVTNTIPVVSEFKANQTSSQFGAAPGNQTLSILTDYFIGEDLQLQANSNKFIYVPTIYRISSLQGNSPLVQLDLSVYVSDSGGNIYPLYLGPLDSMDSKILFLEKGLTA